MDKWCHTSRRRLHREYPTGGLKTQLLTRSTLTNTSGLGFPSLIMASTFIDFICSPGDLPCPLFGCLKVGVSFLPIAEVAIGSVYLNECPRQPYIPIYLIVGGVFGLIVAIFACLPCTKKNDTMSKLYVFWMILMFLFFFAWFIAGNVWVYKIYQPNYDKNTTDIDPYCNKTLYLFAFWTTTLLYIVLGASLVYALCKHFKIIKCGQE